MKLQEYYVSTGQLAAFGYGPQEAHIIASRSRKSAELADGAYVDWLTLARYDVRAALHVLPEAVAARLGAVNAVYDDALRAAASGVLTATGACTPAPAFIQAVATENLIWRVQHEFAALGTCSADAEEHDALPPVGEDAISAEIADFIQALLGADTVSITITTIE